MKFKESQVKEVIRNIYDQVNVVCEKTKVILQASISNKEQTEAAITVLEDNIWADVDHCTSIIEAFLNGAENDVSNFYNVEEPNKTETQKAITKVRIYLNTFFNHMLGRLLTVAEASVGLAKFEAVKSCISNMLWRESNRMTQIIENELSK